MFKDIKSGYHGGLSDVFKPHLLGGYYYDVVSLYPYIMSKVPMPVGNITLSDDTNLDSYFGFVLAHIKCDPAKVPFPFLPIKNQNNDLCTP
jgi:hypothetical protein